MEALIIEIIALALKQVAQLAEDLQNGTIDVSLIDLEKVRAGLISLPLLPEREG